MLQPGDRAPDAHVWIEPRTDGTPLSSLLEGRSAIVVFYLLDWSFT